MKKILLLSIFILQMLNAANLQSDRFTYEMLKNEPVQVSFTNVKGNDKNWIGIYPFGASNAWENVVAWKWVGNKKNGTLDFGTVGQGEYEARLFYNNSFKLEAKSEPFLSELGGEWVAQIGLETDKKIYGKDTPVKVSFFTVANTKKNWLGIYPAGSSNAWGNVVAWKWMGNEAQGTLTFNGLKKGRYEARIFYRNSFRMEKEVAFEVAFEIVNDAQLKTDKEIYQPDQQIKVIFSNLANTKQNWIGIYPVDSSNAFKNVAAWKWTNDTTNGTLIFNGLAKGKYEARVFYNNSVKLEAKNPFQIKGTTQNITSLDTDKAKAIYNINENVIISFKGMKAHKDWMGIYPAEASNAWENVVQWSWTDDLKEGSHTFKNLPAGNYEARVFFDNSFKLEEKIKFSVQDLMKEAKEQCLVKGQSTNKILCTSANRAYVLDNSKLFVSTLHIADFNKIALGESIAKINAPNPHNTYIGFHILKDTKLIAIDKNYDMGDLIDTTTFYNLEGKVQFSTATYQNHNDFTNLRGTIKTIENGKKLNIRYQSYRHNLAEWLSYEDLYDITNINDIKNISHTKI